MLKRLLVGLVLGVVVGGAVGAAIVKGLGITSFAESGGMFLAYIAAMVTGVLAALVAGKPIWAKGAWIEVGLKAFFGALLAAGAMFALRKWGDYSVNLSSFGAGSGTLAELPITSLPIIATVLSVFYELDNTDPPDEAKSDKSAPGKKRVTAGQEKRSRVADELEDGGDEGQAQPKKRMK